MYLLFIARLKSRVYTIRVLTATRGREFLNPAGRPAEAEEPYAKDVPNLDVIASAS